jgi:hypothetical protein
VSSPRFSREAFAPPEPSFEDSNGNGPHGDPNGDSPEFADETRPRASFGVPGTGPAGGFEGHPFAPPGQPLPEGSPSADHGDGFSQPTLAGAAHPDAAATGSNGGPAGSGGSNEQPGYAEQSPFGVAPGDGPSGYAGPPTEYAGPPTEYAGPPTDYAGPPTEYAAAPDYAGAPTEFSAPPSEYAGSSGGFGEPTMAVSGGPGLAPPHQPPVGPPPGLGGPGPSGVGVPAPSTSRGRPQQQRARGPRRAKLQLRHINPWTVLKFSCVLSVALFFVWLITIGLLYGILQAAGVIDQINNAVTTINGNGSKDPVTPGLVFGGSAIIGVINVVLFIALSTVGSVVYNLCADLVGGIEVTLSERE